jgi:aryl sulfotransferase
MAETVAGLLRAWSRRRERAHLLRYEDLVADPAAALSGVLAYLELDQSPATVEAALAAGSEEVLRLPGASHEPAEVAAHRTAADGDSSVGRWRRESDQAFTAATQDAFGEALAAFGYL